MKVKGRFQYNLNLIQHLRSSFQTKTCAHCVPFFFLFAFFFGLVQHVAFTGFLMLQKEKENKKNKAERTKNTLSMVV